MKDIGEKIKDLRLLKGYSQEGLANHSGVSIRTIQRIEKGEVVPRGQTLQLLCEVLDVSIEELSFRVASEQPVVNTSVKVLYLLVLVGLVVPFGNVLGPLVGWGFKKEEDSFVDVVGKNVILTQVVYSIVIVLIGFFAVFIGVQSRGYVLEICLLFILLLTVLNYGVAIYAGIKPKTNKRFYLPFFNLK